MSIFYAIDEDDIKLVEYYVEEGDIEYSDMEHPYTPLAYAAKKGFLNIVEYLVEHGADVNAIDTYGRTPICFAVEGGHLHVLKYLIKIGVEIEEKTWSGYYLYSALSWATIGGQLRVIKFLFNKGANLLANDIYGRIPIFHAAANGQLKTFNYLSKEIFSSYSLPNFLKSDKDFLEFRHDFYMVESNWKKSIFYTVKYGHLQILEQLIKAQESMTSIKWEMFGGKINYLEHEFWQPNWTRLVFLAATRDHCNIVKYLNFRIERRKYVYRAVMYSNLKAVACLVENGANVNFGTTENKTPLHVASANGNFEIVKYLIKEGAELDAKNNEGNTPLHFAVFENHLEVVKHIIEQGADISITAGRFDQSILHDAAERGNVDMVKYLLEKKVNINSKTREGYTPLHKSVLAGKLEVAKLLIENGGQYDEKSGPKGNSIFHDGAERGWLKIVEYLLELGFDINALDSEGNSALSKAMSTSMFDVVWYLIKEGADLKSGFTKSSILQSAVEKNNLKLVKYLKNSTNIDINTEDKEGYTVLEHAALLSHKDLFVYLYEEEKLLDEKPSLIKRPILVLAAGAGNLEVVKYLFTKSPNEIDVVDSDGLTALLRAVLNNHVEVAKYLIRKGADVSVESPRGIKVFQEAAERGQFGLVKECIQHSKNDIENDLKNFLLSHALWRSDLNFTDYMLSLGANINFISRGKHAETRTIERHADTPFCIETILHSAIGKGIDWVKYIVANGADLTAVDKEGYTALHRAVLANKVTIP